MRVSVSWTARLHSIFVRRRARFSRCRFAPDSPR